MIYGASLFFCFCADVAAANWAQGMQGTSMRVLPRFNHSCLRLRGHTDSHLCVYTTASCGYRCNTHQSNQCCKSCGTDVVIYTWLYVLELLYLSNFARAERTLSHSQGVDLLTITLIYIVVNAGTSIYATCKWILWHTNHRQVRPCCFKT